MPFTVTGREARRGGGSVYTLKRAGFLHAVVHQFDKVAYFPREAGRPRGFIFGQVQGHIIFEYVKGTGISPLARDVLGAVEEYEGAASAGRVQGRPRARGRVLRAGGGPVVARRRRGNPPPRLRR